MENNVLIGLENLVYAPLTDEATNTYGAVTAVANSIKASIKPKVNSTVIYGDNSALQTLNQMAEVDVELEVTGLTVEIIAALLGHTVAGGVITESINDVAPNVAIGFKAKKSNGKYRYIWLLKGTFSLMDEEYSTSEDKPKLSTSKLKGTFLARTDGNFKYTADSDSGEVTDTFLSAVYSPTVDLVAPTYVASPVDGATNVSKTNSFTVTFNKAMNTSTVNSSSMFLVKDSDSSVVALTITWDTDKKVATLAHSALTGATLYDLVLTTAIKSKDGVSIASNAIISFTTIA